MATLGQTLTILTGGIDLSPGGVVTLCNVVCVLSMNPDSTWGSVPALGAAVAMGLACGIANGVLVTKERLTPIIVTIAATAVFDDMALLLIPNLGGSVYEAFARFLIRGYSGTAPFLLLILILCLVRCLANSMPYNKASGVIRGGENTAYSADIQVGKIKSRAYCLVGLLRAAAGIFLSIQTNSADATIGKNYAMSTITATVVGGTAMTGAAEDPLGIIVGVFIISIINNILNLFGVSLFYQFICRGLILVVALLLSTLHKRRQGLWELII